jgi:hypothetical protein
MCLITEFIRQNNRKREGCKIAPKKLVQFTDQDDSGRVISKDMLPRISRVILPFVVAPQVAPSLSRQRYREPTVQNNSQESVQITDQDYGDNLDPATSP